LLADSLNQQRKRANYQIELTALKERMRMLRVSLNDAQPHTRRGAENLLYQPRHEDNYARVKGEDLERLLGRLGVERSLFAAKHTHRIDDMSNVFLDL
jgi:hypothetical protein